MPEPVPGAPSNLILASEVALGSATTAAKAVRNSGAGAGASPAGKQDGNTTLPAARSLTGTYLAAHLVPANDECHMGADGQSDPKPNA